MLLALPFGSPPSVHQELLPVVDLYQVFRLEPIPNLYPGVTKILLRLEKVFGLSAFPTVRKILTRMNFFLREIKQLYQSAGLELDLSNSGKHEHLNGLLLKDGFLGMLESKEYRTSDPFSLFWIFMQTGG